MSCLWKMTGGSVKICNFRGKKTYIVWNKGPRSITYQIEVVLRDLISVFGPPGALDLTLFYPPLLLLFFFVPPLPNRNILVGGILSRENFFTVI